MNSIAVHGEMRQPLAAKKPVTEMSAHKGHVAHGSLDAIKMTGHPLAIGVQR